MRFLGGILALLLVTGVTVRRFCDQFKGRIPREHSEAETFANEILLFAKTGYKSELFSHYIHDLALPKKLPNLDWRSLAGHNEVAVCTICQSVMKTVMSMRRKGFSTNRIQATMTHLCTLLNIQTTKVCRGVLQTQLPTILYIIDADPRIDLTDVCGLSIRSGSCSNVSERYNWTIDINNNPPKTIPLRGTAGTFKIVQLTDIHYDPHYKPNENSFCEELMCCRQGQTAMNTSVIVPAGHWGDYNACDVPWHTVEDALANIKTHHNDTTYIYFTGDLIDHGVWAKTKEGNTQSITKSYEKMKETFSNITVYPIIGNDEPHPANLFAPSCVTEENFSTQWLYKLMADLWIKNGWLPESTRGTILQGGFYTVLTTKGYRVIALNNNVCYAYNWWLLLKPRDPNGQLRWLADTLLKAETDNEFVHILAHIPPGNRGCYAVWSREYRKIVNRFANIIKAEFNGHTHYDEFKVYYDLRHPKKPVTVAWTGGSITTYAYLNPNYKVYTANAQSSVIENIDTWIFNLTEANRSPGTRPTWYKSYSFKEEYGLSNLSTQTLHDWIVKASTDSGEFAKYRRNLYKRAEPSMRIPCDEKCMRYLLCSIGTTSSSDKNPCGFLGP